MGIEEIHARCEFCGEHFGIAHMSGERRAAVVAQRALDFAMATHPCPTRDAAIADALKEAQ